ncbi:hypothetical protein [Halalkalibacter krulwichiae]|uniref:Uncharacterized protein n=1 Tax=Halalkalibacter krulwichiae TaxID=199441 RepID=A0A1X9MIC2_9BACI|nr:hypothetical protein [Halalkalibacter krulwichiae]ARK32003.1 hypothetical protein BkAM31D_20330 [Halalkalibacter krulwichiae]
MTTFVDQRPFKKISYYAICSLLAVFVMFLISYVHIISTSLLTEITFINNRVGLFVSSLFYLMISTSLYGLTIMLYQKMNGVFISGMYITVLLTTSMLYALFVSIGFFFFLIPGVILMIVFAFYPFVVIKDGKSNGQALRESASIVKTVWFRLASLTFFFYLLYILLATCFVYVPFIDEMLAQVTAASLLVPFEAFAYYFMYQKGKMKKIGGERRD